MKKLIKILFCGMLIFTGLYNPVYCSQNVVPFTQEDRNRIIQIEEKMNSQQRQIDDIKIELTAVRQEIKDVKQEIKDVKQALHEEIQSVKLELMNLFYWGFGILFAMVLSLFGYIVWDRRTALTPLSEKTSLVEAKLTTLVYSLKEYSKENPKLAEILKMNGFL